MGSNSITYYVPYWEDRLDLSFDFREDAFGPMRETGSDGFAHELFSTPPYDGLLLSRGVVDKSPSGYDALCKKGARSYLRLPSSMSVFGDCGAFSYVNEDQPLYETEDVLEYYEAVGVDYGASVDHLVVSSIYKAVPTDGAAEGEDNRRRPARLKVPMSDAEKMRRRDLTLKNAEDFIRLHSKRGLSFTPVGVAQGWSPKTYSSSVSSLVKMGYRWIALGGLARSRSSDIMAILKEVNRTLDRSQVSGAGEVRFHLFGVAKLDMIANLQRYRVASMDSASYLRKAWLRSGQNYLATDGQWYTAIRVPQSSHARVQDYISKNGKTLDQVRAEESYCLEMLQRYGDGRLAPAEFERLLDALVDYDTYLLRAGDDGRSFREKTISREKYRRTLQDRPWEKCSCEVCRDLGIHALIFRGTNRNKRRGFHNTWVFHQRLKAAAGLRNGE